jgi:hypothetical protein
MHVLGAEHILSKFPTVGLTSPGSTTGIPISTSMLAAPYVFDHEGWLLLTLLELK